MKFSDWQKKYLTLRRAIVNQSGIVEETDNSERAYKEYYKTCEQQGYMVILDYESWCASKKLRGISLEIGIKEEQAMRDYDFLVNLRNHLPLCMIRKMFREENPYWERMKERYSL